MRFPRIRPLEVSNCPVKAYRTSSGGADSPTDPRLQIMQLIGPEASVCIGKSCWGRWMVVVPWGVWSGDHDSFRLRTNCILPNIKSQVPLAKALGSRKPAIHNVICFNLANIVMSICQVHLVPVVLICWPSQVFWPLQSAPASASLILLPANGSIPPAG